MPYGLLHCLHAAAHSAEDKSLSAVHHRVKIPLCTSHFTAKTTELVLLKRICDPCYLSLIKSFLIPPTVVLSFSAASVLFFNLSVQPSSTHRLPVLSFSFFLHWSLPLILPLPQADMVLIADCWEIHDKGEPCSTDITEPFPLGKPHKEQLQHQHTGTAQWNRIINTKSCTIMMLLSSLRTIQHFLSNLFASTELLCLTANDGNQMCNVFSPRRCFIIFSELIDP